MRPSPDIATVTTPPGLAVMERSAARAAATLGSKRTWAMQVSCSSSVAPAQSLVIPVGTMVKSPGFWPERASDPARRLLAIVADDDLEERRVLPGDDVTEVVGALGGGQARRGQRVGCQHHGGGAAGVAGDLETRGRGCVDRGRVANLGETGGAAAEAEPGAVVGVAGGNDLELGGRGTGERDAEWAGIVPTGVADSDLKGRRAAADGDGAEVVRALLRGDDRRAGGGVDLGVGAGVALDGRKVRELAGDEEEQRQEREEAHRKPRF